MKATSFDPILLREALFHVQEMMERALIPFFVLGTTGRHLYKNEETLKGDEEIRVGIKKAELTKEALSTLKSFIPGIDVSEYQLSYEYSGVPVIIDVIHTDYQVFKHPDTRYFYISEFKIPNPWGDYWERRDFIKWVA